MKGRKDKVKVGGKLGPWLGLGLGRRRRLGGLSGDCTPFAVCMLCRRFPMPTITCHLEGRDGSQSCRGRVTARLPFETYLFFFD